MRADGRRGDDRPRVERPIVRAAGLSGDEREATHDAMRVFAGLSGEDIPTDARRTWRGVGSTGVAMGLALAAFGRGVSGVDCLAS
jgi:hypothetical protein